MADPYRPIPLVTTKPSSSFHRPYFFKTSSSTTYKPYIYSNNHYSTNAISLDDDSYPLYPGDAVKFRPTKKPSSYDNPHKYPINNDIYSSRPYHPSTNTNYHQQNYHHHDDVNKGHGGSSSSIGSYFPTTRPQPPQQSQQGQGQGSSSSVSSGNSDRDRGTSHILPHSSKGTEKRCSFVAHEALLHKCTHLISVVKYPTDSKYLLNLDKEKKTQNDFVVMESVTFMNQIFGLKILLIRILQT